MSFYKLSFLGFLLIISQIVAGQNINSTERSIIIDSIPFELTSHNNISIKAILNKVDTLNLMFHTAAGSVTLIEESVKRLKSTNWNKEYNVKSWGGEASSRYSENNSLQIGKLQWENLAIWENKNSGPKTDGKFGPNLFEDKVIEIDFDHSLLKIYSTLPSKIEYFEKLHLIYENGDMFIDLVSVVGENSYKNRFLIHSGYGGTVLYDDKFVETSKIGEKLQVIEESQLKDSYGNILKTKKAILPLFTIGKTVFKDMPIGFFEGAIGRQKMSVIGGNLLKRFDIIIDADRKHIYLKENQLTNLIF